jgi:hypothetical protein
VLLTFLLFCFEPLHTRIFSIVYKQGILHAFRGFQVI